MVAIASKFALDFHEKLMPSIPCQMHATGEKWLRSACITGQRYWRTNNGPLSYKLPWSFWPRWAKILQVALQWILIRWLKVVGSKPVTGTFVFFWYFCFFLSFFLSFFVCFFFLRITVEPRYLELTYFELPLISKWKSGPCFNMKLWQQVKK